MMHRSLRTALAISIGLSVFQVAASGDDAPLTENPTSSAISPLLITAMDCQLGDDKSLSGRVLNRLGKPVANERIVMSQSAANAVSVATDKLGRFRFRDLRPGVMAVTVGPKTQMVRVWNAKMAPPQARTELMLVVGDVVRGQCHGGPNCSGCDSCHSAGYSGHFGGFFQRILHNPWIVSAGMAAAIAIPLAMDDDDAS